MRELLNRHGLGMVWTVVCVKSVGRSLPQQRVRISGAYRLSEPGTVGFMRAEEV